MMFLRVEPQQAGPNALGILVPQGEKTLVIVRPRALPWDLLPARWTGERGQPPQFCVFTRDEAAGIARRFIKALEAAVTQNVNPLESFGDAQQNSCGIWLRADEFVWIVCRRAQGQAYHPMTFASAEEAAGAGEKLAAVVWPAGDVPQEYYFNTQNFS
jgi:hypothetical protein